MGRIVKSKEKLLKKIFYDASHPAGYGTAPNLLFYAKKKNKKITGTDVKNFLIGQKTFTAFARRTTGKKKYRKYLVFRRNAYWSIDLVSAEGLKNQSRGFSYYFAALDHFSKKGFTFPLRTKKPTELASKFAELIQNNDYQLPRRIVRDNGKEFFGKFQQLMDELEIEAFPTTTGNKAVLVEKFNGTLQSYLYKVMFTFKDYDFAKYLPLVTEAYNRRPGVFGYSPNFCYKKENEGMIRSLYIERRKREVADYEAKNREPKFSVGQKVKKRNKKTKFFRGYQPTFADDVETVERVILSRPPTYRLEGDAKTYYSHDLTPIDPENDGGQYYVIVKTRKASSGRRLRSGKERDRDTEYLVKEVNGDRGRWIDWEELKRLQDGRQVHYDK